MNINDITYAINGVVFEVNRVPGPGFLEPEIKSMPAIAPAQARRAGMVLNLPEGHDG